ncbi:uncharacterized protein LOC5515137 isoform X2 [Nematostella vectensis]|uniref:uncharacterized protein LOC5515137 isoform X2 n=1 Tax=Nematostella vectensis TaxID=45351 RepID=UPI0013905F2C|nr:uncharacterized protein LOC5515137 isoform X2 [Nematostella vectensis]
MNCLFAVISGIIFVQVYLSGVSSSGAWYAGTDHYWPMSAVQYWRVHEWYRRYKELWTGILRGGSQDTTYSPANVGISMAATDSWLDLQSHNDTCYVEPALCTEGLSLAFWVNIRGTAYNNTLLSFGGCDRGLRLNRLDAGELEVRLKSAVLGETWRLQSPSGKVDSGRWHHIVVTWNASDGLKLYLDGSRLQDVINTHSTNQSTWVATNWSLMLGREPCCGVTTPMDLDELALWSYPISNETVAKVYEWRTGVWKSHLGCPGGWTSFQQFCYHASVENPSSWTSARSTCKANSADLASIVSAEEFTFTEKLLRGFQGCVYIGLTSPQGLNYSWTDGSIWGFHKLVNASRAARTNSSLNQCVHRVEDGTWRVGDCSQLCGHVCKRYRGIFQRGEFYCRTKFFDQGLAEHRTSIIGVEAQMDCALACLIYGQGLCRSYNYQQYSTGYPQYQDRRICELNWSKDHKHLVAKYGFQYCERL